VETRDINEAISFSGEKMKKSPIFDSDKLFYDAYCLMPGQEQKVHTHDESDKIYYVLQGTLRFTIANEEQDLGPGTAVIARAGDPHGVRNDTDENAVLLVTMAPRPA
jgi:quercetin dioxygenase-like cupin family protein